MALDQRQVETLKNDIIEIKKLIKEANKNIVKLKKKKEGVALYHAIDQDIKVERARLHRLEQELQDLYKVAIASWR